MRSFLNTLEECHVPPALALPCLERSSLGESDSHSQIIPPFIRDFYHGLNFQSLEHSLAHNGYLVNIW